MRRPTNVRVGAQPSVEHTNREVLRREMPRRIRTRKFIPGAVGPERSQHSIRGLAGGRSV